MTSIEDHIQKKQWGEAQKRIERVKNGNGLGAALKLVLFDPEVPPELFNILLAKLRVHRPEHNYWHGDYVEYLWIVVS